MNKLLICTGLTMALAACGGNEPSTGSQPPAPKAPAPAATQSPASPVIRTFADSAAETGWFRLNDAATFAAAKASHRCSIERINGKKPVKGQPVTVALGQELTVNGWVADPMLRTPDRFLVVLRSKQGTYATNASAGRKREDVAAALKSEMLADAGFRSRKPLDAVRPGEYSVSLLEFVDGQYSTCASPARLAVVE
ncbi:MAG TPA: hypothetical protein VM619_00475 [Luteimonas sp.]|nr:hypothetical protein [Luteimonas sp.]